MSLHKLTAGSGYDYLTRQVAAFDATEKGHLGLASYYQQSGETPGVWIGTGMAGLGGLRVGDPVTAGQMANLFGTGLHPLAEQRIATLEGPDLTPADYRWVTRLGAPFKVYTPDVTPFRIEVAKRVAAANKTLGQPADNVLAADVRARIRSEVGREYFTNAHGRPPGDERELAGAIAKMSRPQTQAVAGFDLTFSPVKSVSTLWALADQPTAAQVELAHRSAVHAALTFIEQHALFTRRGTNGVRQVDVQGLVGAAFTHRDSRAGDPDLHTHVAVANKVQTLDGAWLAIDGRILYKAAVTASETYNASLEQQLRSRLGVAFVDRPNPDPGKRPIREIVGVDQHLLDRWSSRRAAIEIRRSQLATQFQTVHGRPPTPVETLHLAQQATLETRDRKHAPRSLAEQRASWRAQAVETLGGEHRLAGMLHAVLHPGREQRDTVTAAWMDATSVSIREAMEARGATWQSWHVRAEAIRQTRTTNLPTDKANQIVDLLIDDVLTHHSIRLTGPADPIQEPFDLRRRSDGASVYTVAGANHYTSPAVLAAETRLLAAAGRSDGRRLSTAQVSDAVARMAAEGTRLNAGQAGLVHTLACSGARVQLAIAPAGSGKTTAMAALATAWTASGGQVFGLAPSAAAAGQLRDQTGAVTDTLAKLVAGLTGSASPPGWAAQVGPDTLVVIDEAAMADTLTLDTAVSWILHRGGSVRLVGDDRQLAAIGAGGILTDIAHTYGAARLTQLLRFHDPAEAAASLALREGRPEALGFYLDQHRIHIADPATLTDRIFDAWRTDRDAGRDALMLAPTRDHVTNLNHRARQHRLTVEPPTNRSDARSVTLADGNQASAGDLIITRTNDRRLRLAPTDWVKNGDRWTVQQAHPNGALTVTHVRSRRTIQLPAGYVAVSTGLGYATSIHTAQGVTADTSHTLLTGDEPRQLLYTSATRGRAANHLYLPVAGDGDPHSLIHPDTIHPATATDILQRILARDDAAQSATTLQRHAKDPAVRLGQATSKYVDGLTVAAETVLGAEMVEHLEHQIDRFVPGVVDEPAWPTLRSHLLLLAVDGHHPLQILHDAIGGRPLDGAHDWAAVLDWRLDDTGHRNTPGGPLPWLPGVPISLAEHPTWGPYLTRRAQLVTDLADQVRTDTLAQPGVPEWLDGTRRRPADRLLGDLAVWRAATAVDPDDHRPTGPVQLQKAAHTWQHHLNLELNQDRTAAVREWAQLIHQHLPDADHDPYLPVLADRLAALHAAGTHPRQLLEQAAAEGPLPDDHTAAALWWRISRHIQPAVLTDLTEPDHTARADWADRLTALIGRRKAREVQDSRYWPALVTSIDHALNRGWTVDRLLTASPAQPAHETDLDPCLALVWRTSLLTDPIPDDQPYEPGHDQPPTDLWDGIDPTPAEPATSPASKSIDDGLDRVEAHLAIAAMIRTLAGPPEPDDIELRRQYARADAWNNSPVTEHRLMAVTQAAADFYRQQYPGSWAQTYLADRIGTDLTRDDLTAPGYAPDGWTGLIRHLDRHGYTHLEMGTAGLTTQTRNGTTIDRFRDRLILPIHTPDGTVLGFVARRHPNLDHADDPRTAGPKYLNTPDTPLFHKGDQLYGTPHLAAHPHAIPVLVEGPLDAIAVTHAGNGRYIGVAPLGTALTDPQAAQLATLSTQVIVATDGDPAGQAAAARAYWILTPHRFDPGYAQLPPGTDPADLLDIRGPDQLIATLTQAIPLAHHLLREDHTHLEAGADSGAAIDLVAARPPCHWTEGLEQVSALVGTPKTKLGAELVAAAQLWNHNPRHAARETAQRLKEPHRAPDAPRSPAASRSTSQTGRSQPIQTMMSIPTTRAPAR